MKNDTTARERLQHQLNHWGANKLVMVTADDLREVLAEEHDEFVRGWNKAADAFGGVHIQRTPEE